MLGIRLMLHVCMVSLCIHSLSAHCINNVISLLQLNNPDMRVTLMKEFAIQNFSSHPLLDYALEVEKITTSKVLALDASGC